MAGIAIVETACGEVKHAHEHGDEHTGLVAFAYRPVDGSLMGRDGVVVSLIVRRQKK